MLCINWLVEERPTLFHSLAARDLLQPVTLRGEMLRLLHYDRWELLNTLEALRCYRRLFTGGRARARCSRLNAARLRVRFAELLQFIEHFCYWGVLGQLLMRLLWHHLNDVAQLIMAWWGERGQVEIFKLGVVCWSTRQRLISFGH